MSSKKQPETKKEQKVQTRYDRKMEERKKRELKEKRETKILRIAAIVLCIAIVGTVAGSITVSVVNKRQAVKNPYVTVGDHAVSRLEYDYYYNTTVNSYLTTYSSLLSYIGYNPELPPEEQQYTEDMTWKDMFDQMTVQQIRQTKALLDDAAADSFTHDSTQDYDSTTANLKSAAETAGSTVAQYYKKTYGAYATEKNVEPFIKDGLLAAAYYDELTARNTPTDEEVKAYYEEHKDDYDKVDYYSFAFAADVAEDASEEDVDRQMLEAKKKADAMLEARKAGEDFETLCIQNAPEDQKENYEKEDTEYSLTEGRARSGVPAALSEWLYEDSRAAGDQWVIEDETNHQYYVVEFLKKYYDEADDANISNTIASDRVTEYVTKLTEQYTVTDNKGELKYLTVEENAETGEEQTGAAQSEEGADSAGQSEEGADGETAGKDAATDEAPAADAAE